MACACKHLREEREDVFVAWDLQMFGEKLVQPRHVCLHGLPAVVVHVLQVCVKRRMAGNPGSSRRRPPDGRRSYSRDCSSPMSSAFSETHLSFCVFCGKRPRWSTSAGPMGEDRGGGGFLSHLLGEDPRHQAAYLRRSPLLSEGVHGRALQLVHGPVSFLNTDRPSTGRTHLQAEASVLPDT